MDTSETNSTTEEEEEKMAAEQRPRTRSNPEGAEDRTLSMQASVGSRSEGEGEAASTATSPPSAAVQAPNGKTWLAPTPPSEFQVRTPRVNCPEKVIICLDLSEEMSHPRLESFNGQQKTELPVTENIQTIPPPYVVRTILVYSRPACQPPVVVTDQMKKMLQCPYFFFDVLYIHNGAEDKEEEVTWKVNPDPLGSRLFPLHSPPRDAFDQGLLTHPSGDLCPLRFSSCLSIPFLPSS
uniref:BRISC and BRCA1 A complex member 1 n=1 Tax=Pseudonaja textilis TaxID=8673 RepID=A0A670ZJM6_PSETE